MPSLLTRLANLFPGFRGTPTVTPSGIAAAPQAAMPTRDPVEMLKDVKDRLDNTPRRPRPSTDEKIPTNYNTGVAGKVWFLPYVDSTTQDTNDIRTAMRLMRRDPYVKAAWEPQVLTVASEDWQIQPSEPDQPESEEQAKFVKTAIEEYLQGGMIAVLRSVLEPLGSDGFCLAEKVPGYAEKGRLQKKIIIRKLAARNVDNSTLRIEGDAFGNVTGVQSMRSPGGEVFPISDFIYSRYAYVFNEPMGEAAFRTSYGAYWMRDTVRKLRIIHTEKKMAGMLVGTYTDPNEKDSLETALQNAKTSTWLSVPEGTRVEAIQLSTASEPDYRSLDESLRDEIVTGIAFATLQIIQGSVPDARGDTKTQKAMADLGPWLLAALATEAINKQLIPDLIDWNFPYAAGGGYPKVTFGAVSNQEILELLQVVEGALRIGLDPSKKHYAKAFSIQEADKNDPEDSLKAAGQQQGMGGFPGATQGAGASPGMGGGTPGATGGFGGGGGTPGGGMFPGGGQAQPFSEFDELVHTFRDAVTWQRQPNGNWKSPGGLVRSDAWYQAHVSRLKSKIARAATKTPPAPRPTQQPNMAQRVAGGIADGVSAAGGFAADMVGELPSLVGDMVGEVPSMVGDLARDVRDTVLGPPKAPVPPKKVGKIKKAATAVANSRTGRAVDWAYSMLAKPGVGGAMVAHALAKKAHNLGRGLETIPWLEEGFGLGSAIKKKANRAKARTKFIKEGFQHGLISGTRRTVREVAKLIGIQYHKSAKKYGPILGAAVELAMFGWTWGVKAAIGTAIGAASGSLAVGGLAFGTAVFAAHRIGKFMDSYLGIGPTRIIRNKLEHIAGGISAKAGRQGKAWGPQQRNSNAPGRVAQQLDWAEGLDPEKIARIARGEKAGVIEKIKLNIMPVSGDRHATGSGRGGKINSPDAIKWLLAKHEVTEADKEGRAPRLDPKDEATIREAMKIQAAGVAAKKKANEDRRTKADKLANIAAIQRDRKLVEIVSGRFSEFAESPDEMELVTDLREGLENLFATLGAPMPDITDDALKGSLAVVLAQMVQRKAASDETEAFAEQGYESFGWQRERTRNNRVKAVGTGEDAGKEPLYGEDALRALENDRKQQEPVHAKQRMQDQVTAGQAEKDHVRVKGERNAALAARDKALIIRSGNSPDGLEEWHTDAHGQTHRYPSARGVAHAAARATAAREKANEWGIPDEGERVGGQALLERMRQRQKDMVTLAPAVKAGNPEAAAKMRDHAVANIEDVSKHLAEALSSAHDALTPATPPPEAHEAVSKVFEESNPGGSGPVHAAVGGFLSGLMRKPAGGIMGHVGQFINFLGRMGGKALKMGVKALARFAWATTKFTAKTAWGIASSDTMRPFVYWAGSIAAAAAIVAAPVVGIAYLGPYLAVEGIKDLAFVGGAVASAAGATVYGVNKVMDIGGRKAGAKRIANQGVQLDPAEDFHSERFGEKDVAIAGKDGEKAAMLLSHAQKDVAAMFAEKCKSAVERLLAQPDRGRNAAVLFSDEELSEIASGMGRVVATADLLGRARIQRHAEIADRRAMNAFAEGDDEEDVFHDFAEPIPPLAPEGAIAYIRSRVGNLNPDASRYGPRLSRHATTLAIASDEVLLEKIKAAIVDELQGQGDATPDIARILEAAGVSHENPQYPEMVARTNAMNAYLEGSSAEMREPGMQERFPVWQYAGIRDGRQGKDHEPHFDKYYSSSKTFGEVRGSRVWNCRCGMTPIYKGDWAKLMEGGAKMES